jgi:hypothetical protein
MNEHSNLLHNMSAPPKSVVKYTGLSWVVTRGIPGGSGVTSIKYSAGSQFGTVVRFILREDLRGASIKKVLASLEALPQGNDQISPDRRLITLINRRAAELPLPDGCAVIKTNPAHEVLWDDPLSALAILSKSTDTVWLRNKAPSLSEAVRRTSISLLIPPAFTDRLLEARI